MNKVATIESFNLTQSQLLLWMGQKLKPNSPMYNMALVFDISDAINGTVFKKAFQLLLQKCDAMRTVFIENDEKPQQKIITDFNYEPSFIDFSAKPEKDVFLKEWLKIRSQQVFDINKCLFDSVLIKMGEQRYIWYFNQHHLITDAWAVTVQYKTFSLLYNNLLKGIDTSSIELPFYANYIKSEALQNTSATQNASADYWAKKADELPDAPIFNNKSNESQFSESERYSIVINKEKADLLRALCMEKDLRTWTQHQSLFNVFASLLFTFVYRMTGQQNLAIGTPVHNRINAHFKETPGMFIKVFPLQTKLSSTDSFSSLFTKVRDENNNLLRHAQTGISEPGLNRGVNVVLNYITATFVDFNGTSMSTDWIHSGHVDPGHHLRMQVHNFNADGSIELAFDLNRAVFSEAKRKVIPQAFIELIDRFIEDRFQSIGFLSEQDTQLLQSYNNTKTSDYPTTKTIVELINEQVQKTPHAVAIAFEGEALTFQELNEKTNQLAHFLQKKGAKEEKLIAICLDRSLEMMIGLLGILKSGAAYVPIDPSYPEKRIQYIIDNAQAEIVICDKQYAPLFSKQKEAEIILINNDWPSISLEPTKDAKTNLKPENLMYVIYTSGSTGQPKGVMNQHSGVVNRLWWAQNHYDLKPQEDVVLQKTTFCFDVSVWELFWPLIAGVKLVFARPEGHKDTDYLKAIIQQEGITTIHFVPPMLEIFLLNIKQGNCSSLKRVLCSGDTLKSSHVNLFKQHFPTVELHNLYGPTEAAIDVTAWQSSNSCSLVSNVPIGKPIDNTQIHILNKEGKLCPIGMIGELHIGGVQVARGYHRQPTLSSAQFINDPFSNDPTAKLYKTGDLARWLPDGNIAFLGRNDHQVKIRGFRIELGEIEAKFQAINDIIQNVVLATEDPLGNKMLTVYFVAKTTIDTAQIKNTLASQLPSYMIPAQLIQLEQMPLTVNGKLDRKALAKIDLKYSANGIEYESAQTEFEEIISEIWSTIMPINNIGIHENFIDLGGDSLMGIRLMTRINEAFELELPINLIFIKPTIASLATYIEDKIRTLLKEMEVGQ